MAWQMTFWDALLLSKFKVAGEVLPVARGIEKEAPPVASDQHIKFFAREHQPIGIRGLGDARLNVRLRKMMLAQLRTAQTEEIVRSRRNATPTVEVTADALGKPNRNSFCRPVQQQVEPFVFGIERGQVNQTVASG